jgi:ABC-type transport system substrate-binding protein
LRIRLTAPDPNFLFYLATPATAVVAREVMQAYGAQAGNHPVGTGPFVMGQWKHSDRITLLANRQFRSVSYQGRRVPLLDDGSVSKVSAFFTSHGPSGPDGLAVDSASITALR